MHYFLPPKVHRRGQVPPSSMPRAVARKRAAEVGALAFDIIRKNMLIKACSVAERVLVGPCRFEPQVFLKQGGIGRFVNDIFATVLMCARPIHSNARPHVCAARGALGEEIRRPKGGRTDKFDWA